MRSTGMCVWTQLPMGPRCGSGSCAEVPWRPPPFDDEGGVEGDGVGHSRPVDHNQCRWPNAYPVGWVVAPNSYPPCTSPFYAVLPAAELGHLRRDRRRRELTRSHPTRVRRCRGAAWHVCVNGAAAVGRAFAETGKRLKLGSGRTGPRRGTAEPSRRPSGETYESRPTCTHDVAHP